jgi:hypothetical protein
MMKKGSLEVGVNFLVVMIVCVILLGGGIWLAVKGIGGATTIQNSVTEMQRAEILRALDNGAQTYVYPSENTVAKGVNADFAIGIYNTLDDQKDFFMTVVPSPLNLASSVDVRSLPQDRPMPIKNTATFITPIKVIVPKATQKGQYIFTVYICKEAQCAPDFSNQYGEIQKIYVNVK